MPEIKSQHQCLNLDDLKRAESFGEPIGELPLQTDSGFLNREDIFAGTWECELAFPCACKNILSIKKPRICLQWQFTDRFTK